MGSEANAHQNLVMLDRCIGIGRCQSFCTVAVDRRAPDWIVPRVHVVNFASAHHRTFSKAAPCGDLWFSWVLYESLIDFWTIALGGVGLEPFTVSSGHPFAHWIAWRGVMAPASRSIVRGCLAI